jgi:hypothetical protein
MHRKPLMIDVDLGSLLLDSTFSARSSRSTSASMARQSPNQALERTATRCAFTLCVAKTSSLRATRSPGGRRSACSR